ncbi:hypothetical protein [Streptomyces sp. CB00072]|uniref:hypothetical protein n=1 Tax=Streptomyces sp. CB00072 TaxID=1703928 RepID=UPI0011610CA7|nr:hypothetical protein [Streptomyces sp. CB00072]
MDYVTGSSTTDPLTPPLYTAWATWEQGKRSEAFTQLNESLGSKFDQTIANPPRELFEGDLFKTFPTALGRLFTKPYCFHVPPTLVAAAIWEQAPRTDILYAILLGDFRWSGDPFEEPADTPGSTELASSIKTQIRLGFISRDPADILFGGRPFLDADLAAETSPEKLGDVYEAAFCSNFENISDWWDVANIVAPKLVLRNFCHDAFRNGRKDLEPADVWSRIKRLNPRYSQSIRKSFNGTKISTKEWNAMSEFINWSDSTKPLSFAIKDLIKDDVTL